jgi:hypothetical protein
MDEEFICGFPDQWKAFHQRNRKFFLRFDHLKKALDATFIRMIYADGPEDRTVFVLGRLCMEDFFEIIQLAGNGYGFGALKLVRSLYERAVTMAFLSGNPSEVDTFLDYHAVAQFKLMQAVKQNYGSSTLSAEATEQTEREYTKVKDNYLVTACAKCGTTRINHTWHKLDVVSMAKKTVFGQLIVAGYYIPMSHMHSTVQSILSRIEETGDEGAGFNPDPQPQEADRALTTAHNIVLGVIETQKNYFNLDALDAPLQTCMQDFVEIWEKKPKPQGEDTGG